MYIQNVNDIKVAVIMLDGCVLDLNRYRFNYYNHLCEKENTTITKEDFYNNLSSMYTMYNQLPLYNKYSSSSINSQIEEELYSYLKYKGIYPKEGLFELLDYFRQKDIQVAIMSTHKTKRAVEYLQLTRVFSYVHFIIGSDTKNKPLPSTEMLKAIIRQFEVSPHQLLVISPFLALNKAAYNLEANIIYYQDLIEPKQEEKQTSFKTVSSYFEILNTLLFDRIHDSKMYSSLLGMNENMNKEQLDSLKSHLDDVYSDDKQLLDIVQDTYEYHISQLINEDIEAKEENISEIKLETIESKESEEEITLIQVNNNTNEEEIEIKEEINSQQSSLSLNEEQKIELTTAWDQLMSKEKIEPEEEIEIPTNKPRDITITDILIYIFSEFIYSFTTSLLVLICGIIFTVITENIIQSIKPIMIIFNGYLSLIELTISSIFNTLHSIIPNIPDYSSYLLSLEFLSNDGIQLFHILIFNAVIIFIIKMIILIIKREELFEEDDE